MGVKWEYSFIRVFYMCVLSQAALTCAELPCVSFVHVLAELIVIFRDVLSRSQAKKNVDQTWSDTEI